MYDNNDYDAAIAQAQLSAKRFAEMRQQPELQGQMVGGRYIAPHGLEYLAQALRQYQGAQGEKAEFEKIKQLTQAKRQAVADALRGYIEKMQGTPENVAADGMGPTRPAQPLDMKAGYEHLMQSGIPQLTQAGLQGYMQMPALEAQQRERDEARTYGAQEAQLTREARMQEAQLAREARMQEAQFTREARMQELQFKLADARAGQAERLAAQKELKQMILSGQKETRQIIGGTQDKPTYDKELGGFVYKPTAQDPQGKIVPLPNSTGQRDAKNALKVIAQAEGLLDKATGSYVGVAADEFARLFGVSTPGARGAAQLKALEGELISKMPKMTGPQSDKDVLLYKQMAGQIGDPTIPADTKRAALEVIKQIQSRYAGVSNVPKDAPQPSAGPSITDLLKKY
jgi:hypothetical protein